MRQICCKSLSIYNWNANANGMPIKSLCKFSQLALVQACSLSTVVWLGRLRFSLWLGTSAGMTGYDKEAWQGACGLIWGLCFRFRTNRMTWCACAYDIYLSGICLPARDLGKRNRNKKCFGLHLYIGNDGFECLYGLSKMRGLGQEPTKTMLCKNKSVYAMVEPKADNTQNVVDNLVVKMNCLPVGVVVNARCD